MRACENAKKTSSTLSKRVWKIARRRAVEPRASSKISEMYYRFKHINSNNQFQGIENIPEDSATNKPEMKRTALSKTTPPPTFLSDIVEADLLVETLSWNY